MNLRSLTTATLAALLLTLSACGDSSDDVPAIDASPQASSASTSDTADSTAPEDPIAANLAGVKAAADSFDEQQTGDGATVVVAIDCDVYGAQHISVAASGLAVGDVYEARGEPSFGGSLALQTLPDGRGVGARQSRLDEPSYAVTFPTLDGGMTFNVEGCPETP